MTREATVHVIDDDAAVRDSVAFLLSSAGLAVVTHESAAAFIAALPGAAVGCVVTDVRMPEIDGLSLLKRLRAAGSEIPVVVITGHGDVPMAVEAMKSGARDFIEKPFKDATLVSVVEAALREGETQLLRRAERAEAETRLASLSERERQVLAGLVAGQANKAIAHALGISPRTVEIYRANVMSKMGAHSLSELVRTALALDLPVGHRGDS